MCVHDAVSHVACPVQCTEIIQNNITHVIPLFLPPSLSFCFSPSFLFCCCLPSIEPNILLCYQLFPQYESTISSFPLSPLLPSPPPLPYLLPFTAFFYISYSTTVCHLLFRFHPTPTFSTLPPTLYPSPVTSYNTQNPPPLLALRIPPCPPPPPPIL